MENKIELDYASFKRIFNAAKRHCSNEVCRDSLQYICFETKNKVTTVRALDGFRGVRISFSAPENVELNVAIHKDTFINGNFRFVEIDDKGVLYKGNYEVYVKHFYDAKSDIFDKNRFNNLFGDYEKQKNNSIVCLDAKFLHDIYACVNGINISSGVTFYLNENEIQPVVAVFDSVIKFEFLLLPIRTHR